MRAAVEALLGPLEEFTRFDGPDPTGRDRAAWTAALALPLPEEGIGLDGLLRELSEIVIPNGIRVGHPGFSGWVNNAPTSAGTAAALAVTVAGPNRWWAQSFNRLETVALEWLRQLLGLPDALQGVFTSGGSTANLVGLGAARQHAFEAAGHDVARDGLPDGVTARIYASSEIHHVVLRAAAVLGLGRRGVVAIPVDANRRFDVAALDARLAVDRAEGVLPVAIAASAGTVNTGAVDPLADLVEVAHSHGTWLHVDGAYGMFGILDPRVAGLFAGIDRADSVVCDPHKWLAAPMGIGAAFVRDRALLGRAFTVEPAEYLEPDPAPGNLESPFDDFGDLYVDFGVEQSAPARGAQVWAILREIGAAGMRARVVRHNSYARHLAALADADDHLELLAEPVLSICCFRYRREGDPEERTEAINFEVMRRLRAGGDFVPSTTRLDGRLAIRPCYINPRTTLAEVDGLAARVRALGDEVAAG
jgi:aromatic-L-amino-acid decarboxylase